MGGSCIANTALYGGMMVTYGDDVNKLKEAGKCKEAVTPATIATGTSVYHSVSNSTVTAITCVNASVSDGSSDIAATACAGISVHKSALNEGMITTASCARAGISTTSESGSTTAVDVTSCVGISKDTKGHVEITLDRSAKVEIKPASGATESPSVVVEDIVGVGEE